MNLGKLRQRVRANIREPRENKVLDDDLNNFLNDLTLEASKYLNYPYQDFTIHGVEEQADYTLPDDYVKLQPLLDVMFDEKKLKKYGVKYLEKKYPLYLKATGVTFPTHYYTRARGKMSLYPPPSLEAEGTATAGSGLAVLIDANADFNDNQLGFSVRNIGDGSNAIITEVTSAIQVTATLSGGTANVWADTDTYKINRSGTAPYVYREDDMVDDEDENIIAAEYPYILIFGVTVIADMIAYRTDSAAQLKARMDRWDTLYNAELVKAKKVINEEIRGQGGRTKSPYERYSRSGYTD